MRRALWRSAGGEEREQTGGGGREGGREQLARLAGNNLTLRRQLARSRVTSAVKNSAKFTLPGASAATNLPLQYKASESLEAGGDGALGLARLSRTETWVRYVGGSELD